MYVKKMTDCIIMWIDILGERRCINQFKRVHIHNTVDDNRICVAHCHGDGSVRH